ncbi:hypothetical protein SAMCFNEI73_pB0242 (plasmid) [Sinorhizobium americanum]|uniref:Uncharacterized protein n=2 Tax=Sinorhizobium americanum TaxID=194963 RepID=A0A1L3LTL9_9HYPH|nr:hypothetical protein SAMCFNEI73_pB0242 [Sinorhizobium americanum]
MQLIKGAKWDKNPEIALESARALNEQETERKRSSESKASIYLAVIAAIFPVLVSLPKDLYGEELPDMSPGWQTVLLGLFVLGVIYLVRSGIWAFRTLAVSTHNRIDATDIVHLWGEPDANSALIRDLLVTTRMNRDEVNAKVAYIKMAHAFLLRTFIAFAILLLVAVLRQPFITLLDAAVPMVRAGVCGS